MKAADASAWDQLRAERPDLASVLSDEQIALLADVLFPTVTEYRGCMVSGRGMAHPYLDDWFDGRHSPAAVEAILNTIVLCDEIDTEDRALHASMSEARHVIADIWRWALAKQTDVALEIWTADDPDGYGPIVAFRRSR